MSGILPNGKQQFIDSNGNPLASGKVYYYIPSTTTFKNTYQDPALTILNTNPIQLDANGQCIAYGSGSYRQQVYDVNNNLIWDQESDSPLSLSDFEIPQGSSYIGYNEGNTGAVNRNVQAKLQESVSILDFGADPTGTNDSTAAIQNALNVKGSIYIPKGIYKVTSTLTIYGNTELFGAGPGISILQANGITSGNIIQDSSLTTSLNVNLNIVLRDFELDCNSYSTGSSCGIIFYRVGDLFVDNIYVHDCGNTLFCYGTSHANTVNIRVSNSRFINARTGDAVNGAGANVSITNCTSQNFGDTGFATLIDTNSTTNPTALAPSNIVYEGCFSSTGNLGFASGPYGTAVDINLTISNCFVDSCQLSAWMIVFNKLKLIGNTFKPNLNTTTGNVRLDGIQDVTVVGNSFETNTTGSGDYSGLFLNAIQNIYGASTFNAPNLYTTITGNVFIGNTSPGIVLFVDPANAMITDLIISSNSFAGINLPIQMLPNTSSGTSIFNRITIAENTANSTATYFLTANGIGPQYLDIILDNNNVGSVPLLGGTGTAYDNFLINGSYTTSLASVSDGVATTVYTMPSTGYETTQITSYVKSGSQAFTATAVLINNAGSSRIAWQSNGANCILTLSGNNVQVTQSGIGAQTVFTTITNLG